MHTEIQYTVKFTAASRTTLAAQQRQFFKALKAKGVVIVRVPGIASAKRTGELPQIIDDFG
jgi:hypothetical protein